MDAAQAVVGQNLSVLSPDDVKFDKKKAIANQVASLYSLPGHDGVTGFISGSRLVEHQTYSARIYVCGSWLKFAKMASGKVKLIAARFCKAPNCPMCQWRRSLLWRGRFLAQLPAITAKYPTDRWVSITLTQKNCKLEDLRQTAKDMGAAFNRMRGLADFPLKGWVRSLEVTRAWDWYDEDGYYLGRHGVTWHKELTKAYDKTKTGVNPYKWKAEPTDEVHPHYHILGLVPASYFGKGYVTQKRLSEMWGKSMRLDYEPIVHIGSVKSKKGQNPIPPPGEVLDSVGNILDQSGIFKAICETMKYTVKEQDLIGSLCNDDNSNSDWLKNFTEQMYNMRRIEYAGTLKEFGKELAKEEDNNENLISGNIKKEEGDVIVKEWTFLYSKEIEKYTLSREV